MYSQNQEQQYILNHFRLKGVKRGVFIDIGANDGITLSNTRALSELGWSGVLVEPSVEAYNRAVKNNENNASIKIFNCAIGSETQEIDFYESGTHLGVNDVSLLSTIKKTELSRWKNETFTEKKTECYTWQDFVDLCGVTKFDFISMDIEGMEKEVLPQINLNEINASLFCIEWNGNDFNFYDSYFKTFDFKLIHQNNENLIYGR
jgi:FkbM family methyltransferase